MTDGRFPERWLNDRRFAKISDSAFKLFVIANTWSAANRTDGLITRDDLTLFPRHVAVDRVHELVAADFWVELGSGWLIAGYAHVQTTAAQLEAAEHARLLDRDRKARSRARKTVSPDDDPVRPDIPPDVPPDSTGQSQGQDRPVTGNVFRGPESSNSGSRLSDDEWAEEWAAANPDVVVNLNGRPR